MLVGSDRLPQAAGKHRNHQRKRGRFQRVDECHFGQGVQALVRVLVREENGRQQELAKLLRLVVVDRECDRVECRVGRLGDLRVCLVAAVDELRHERRHRVGDSAQHVRLIATPRQSVQERERRRPGLPRRVAEGLHQAERQLLDVFAGGCGDEALDDLVGHCTGAHAALAAHEQSLQQRLGERHGLVPEAFHEEGDAGYGGSRRVALGLLLQQGAQRCLDLKLLQGYGAHLSHGAGQPVRGHDRPGAARLRWLRGHRVHQLGDDLLPGARLLPGVGGGDRPLLHVVLAPLQQLLGRLLRRRRSHWLRRVPDGEVAPLPVDVDEGLAGVSVAVARVDAHFLHVDLRRGLHRHPPRHRLERRRRLLRAPEHLHALRHPRTQSAVPHE